MIVLDTLFFVDQFSIYFPVYASIDCLIDSV